MGIGLLLLAAGLSPATGRSAESPAMTRLAYNNPGLLVDLGVGLWAWPLPMDFNGDGLMDLVVACTDKPSNGIYVFINTGRWIRRHICRYFRPPGALGRPDLHHRFPTSRAGPR